MQRHFSDRHISSKKNKAIKLQTKVKRVQLTIFLSFGTKELVEVWQIGADKAKLVRFGSKSMDRNSVL